MNFDGALGLIQKAMNVESSEHIQEKLEAVRDRLDQIISNPTEPSYQTGLINDIKSLRLSLSIAANLFTPLEQGIIERLAKGPEFSPRLVDDIQEYIDENAATLAVARDSIQKLTNGREKTIEHFEAVLAAADYLSWTDDEPHNMPAEAGFLIPRNIFDNSFSGLISELNFIKRFVSLLAEASGEKDARIELIALSTTDPLITLGVALGVASLIGKAASWALNSWKSVEEIREIRARTKKLASFSDEEVEQIFGEKIRLEVEAAISKEAARLAADMKASARKNEVSNGLELCLREFLARVERGMTVEVKLIKGAATEEGGLDDVSATISSFSQSLRFPPVAGDPILAITSPDQG